MTTHSGSKRRYHASSPFRPEPEPIIDQYAVNDLVSHDSHGVGRVVGKEDGAVTVDFGTKTLRIMSPFRKMTRL